jgi:hypothetical protein
MHLLVTQVHEEKAAGAEALATTLVTNSPPNHHSLSTLAAVCDCIVYGTPTRRQEQQYRSIS